MSRALRKFQNFRGSPCREHKSHHPTDIQRTSPKYFFGRQKYFSVAKNFRSPKISVARSERTFATWRDVTTAATRHSLKRFRNVLENDSSCLRTSSCSCSREKPSAARGERVVKRQFGSDARSPTRSPTHDLRLSQKILQFYTGVYPLS